MGTLFAQAPPDGSIAFYEGSPVATGGGHFEASGTYKLPANNPPKMYQLDKIIVYWAKEPVLKDEDWYSADAVPDTTTKTWSYKTTTKLDVGSKYQVKAHLKYVEIVMGGSNSNLNAYTATPNPTVVIK